jgi:hypothetical protein
MKFEGSHPFAQNANGWGTRRVTCGLRGRAPTSGAMKLRQMWAILHCDYFIES